MNCEQNTHLQSHEPEWLRFQENGATNKGDVSTYIYTQDALSRHMSLNVSRITVQQFAMGVFARAHIDRH